MRRIFLFLVTFFIVQFAYAGSVGAGDGLMSDAEHLKDAVTQWGATVAGIAVILSASLAVASMILPWRFLKETLGRPAWVGLACAVTMYIVMSFFGNSIQQAVTRIFQCPLQIIGITTCP